MKQRSSHCLGPEPYETTKPSEQSREVRRKEKTKWRLAAAWACGTVANAEASREALKHSLGGVEPKGVIPTFRGCIAHICKVDTSRWAVAVGCQAVSKITTAANARLLGDGNPL